jgi:hypothetical protein
MTAAEEMCPRRWCRQLHACGPRAVEEFILEVAARLSWRTPLENRVRDYVRRLDAAGGRRTLDALGANDPIRPPWHLVRER